MLRKTTVVLAIAVALGGSTTLPTNAFAAGRTFEGGRMASGAKAGHRSDLVLNGLDYERHALGQRSSHEWDPWGHWGAYYGPNPAPL